MILAIKAIDVINFAELLELPVIKQLTSKHPEVSQLLNLFNDVSATEFEPQIAKFSSLMEREGLTKQELIRKKSYVQICTLSTQSKTNYKYTELSQLLNIAEPEIEEWAVEAIQNKIIDAKIDQLNEEIVIKSHMLIELKEQEWRAIQQKIVAWR